MRSLSWRRLRFVGEFGVEPVTSHRHGDECDHPSSDFFIFRELEFSPVDNQERDTDWDKGGEGHSGEENEEEIGDEDWW